jgi:carbon-monoxide dehydrogenase medium subunit
MYTMRPAEFEYHRPTSLEEAIELLGEVEGSRPIAGGHSLLPMMKLRLAAPAALVDLGGIPGLDGIEGNGELTIGALATHASVLASEVAIGIAPVVPETAGQIGDRQVRNRGTMGGSVAHADPGADYPTVVTALGATVVVRGPNGELEIAADGFFTGVFTTELAQGELVTAVRVPSVQKAAYVKHRHPASGYAVVGVACVVGTDEARIVVGGVTGTPVLFAVSPVEAAAIEAVAEEVPDALSGALSDTYASGEYRVHLAQVLAKRAIKAAFETA